jgi:hypothetical protein
MTTRVHIGPPWEGSSIRQRRRLPQDTTYSRASLAVESLMEDIQIPERSSSPPVRWRVGIGPDPADGRSGSS